MQLKCCCKYAIPQTILSKTFVSESKHLVLLTTFQGKTLIHKLQFHSFLLFFNFFCFIGEDTNPGAHNSLILQYIGMKHEQVHFHLAHFLFCSQTTALSEPRTIYIKHQYYLLSHTFVDLILALSISNLRFKFYG